MNMLKNIYKSTSLTEKELGTIIEKHELITLSKGQFLLTEGQYSRGYYCIEKGLLRTCLVDYNGNDITTSFIGEGDIAIGLFPLAIFMSSMLRIKFIKSLLIVLRTNIFSDVS